MVKELIRKENLYLKTRDTSILEDPLFAAAREHSDFGKGEEEDYTVYLPRERVIQIDEQVERLVNTVLPTQVIEHFIRVAGYRFIVDFCVCREAQGCQDYPIGLGCLYLGESAKEIHPELGHSATAEEAIEFSRRCREAGLIHFFGRDRRDSSFLGVGPRLMTICNCCPCCCYYSLRASKPVEVKGNDGGVRRMPGISVQVNDNCIACETCVESFKFNAVSLEGDQAVVETWKIVPDAVVVLMCAPKRLLTSTLLTQVMWKRQSREYPGMWILPDRRIEFPKKLDLPRKKV
jgi:hypothetical protein